MPTQDKRLRRLQRLSELIRRKLDSAVAALAAAQQAHMEAKDALASIKHQLQEAIQTRCSELSAGAQAEQFRIRHAWQETLQTRALTASGLVETRAKQVVEARTVVLIANEDLQKLNSLIHRVQEYQQIESNRLERKAEDATYAALAALAPRHDGP
jgi:flagellar export protein FliJ